MATRHLQHPGRSAIPWIVLLAALAGCAPLPPAPAPEIHYLCESGKEFSVRMTPSGDSASIEILRMHFVLFAEPARGSGKWYGCDELTLQQDGDTAQVEMTGIDGFKNCRKKP